MEVYEKLLELQNISGKNDKKDVVKKYIEDSEFIYILMFLVNDFIKTGINKKKITKAIVLETEDTILNAGGMIQYLTLHSSGKDYDVHVIQNFLNTIINPIKQDVYRKLAIKEFKIGISAKTWNSIVKGNEQLQVPVFDVMLAKSYDDHGHKVKGDFVITEKKDGNRLIVIKEGDIVKSYTRSGKEYYGLEEIENEIKEKILHDIILDGEIIADVKGTSLEQYAETSKLARSKDKNKTGLSFHVFDMITPEEFRNGKSKDNAIKRKLNLSALFKLKSFIHLQEVLPLYIGNDIKMIDSLMITANENNWEGLIINTDTPYVCKRTDSLLKVKKFRTADLEIIGFEEGKNKNENTLGRINVKYKNNTVGVGGGFSDAQRDKIWKNQDSYLGKIIEVKYFEETFTDGKYSLRFPTFKKLRLDKTEESYN